jgi:hypothetical protein
MKQVMAGAVGVVVALGVLACAAMSAPSESGGSAKAFAERIVRALNDTTSGAGDWEHLGRHGGYDPSFVRLMDENDRLAQGVDLLDADPLCQCQDSGGHYRLVSLSQTGPDSASARIADEDGAVTAILKRTAGAWRVYDVVDASGSFRANLIRHNACMRTHHTDAQQVRCFGGH